VAPEFGASSGATSRRPFTRWSWHEQSLRASCNMTNSQEAIRSTEGAECATLQVSPDLIDLLQVSAHTYLFQAQVSAPLALHLAPLELLKPVALTQLTLVVAKPLVVLLVSLFLAVVMLLLLNLEVRSGRWVPE